MYSLHGIVFAYEAARELKELVETRTSSSIPFAGRYRLIDFPISCMVNAGVSDIGVIMQRGYQSLMDHLGSGRDWNLNRQLGGLKLLPPFGYADTQREVYRSRMEALRAVYVYLNRIRQDYVVISRGDIAANIDIDDIFKKHVDSGTDVTIVCTDTPQLPLKDSSFVIPDSNGFIEGTVNSPIQKPGGYQSMELYILSKELLMKIVEYGNVNKYLSKGDLLQVMTEGRKSQVYIYDGYVAAITSVDAYYKKSMELLKPGVREQLFREDAPIMTKVRSDVSTHYDTNSKVKNCLVADGCFIEGDIESCVLFRGVRVGRGAVLKNCVIMQDTVIGESTNLSHVITDKNVTISPYVTLTSYETFPITIAKNSLI